MANKLIVAPAPHEHGSESTQKIMRDVLLALTPALVFSVVAFGWSALAVTCISVASCVLFEYLIQKFLLKGPCTVSDLSAVVTGVLLASYGAMQASISAAVFGCVICWVAGRFFRS